MLEFIIDTILEETEGLSSLEFFKEACAGTEPGTSDSDLGRLLGSKLLGLGFVEELIS